MTSDPAVDRSVMSLSSYSLAKIGEYTQGISEGDRYNLDRLRDWRTIDGDVRAPV